MTHRSEHPQDEFQDQLPAALGEDLAALYGGRFGASASRDRLILSSARAHLAGRRRHRLLRRWGGAAAAIAAAVVLAFVLLPRGADRRQQAQQHSPTTTASSPAPDIRDLNTDGQVNILDAYLLAKQVERTTALDLAMDFNADGRVDRLDADAVAAASVQIKGGELQ